MAPFARLVRAGVIIGGVLLWIIRFMAAFLLGLLVWGGLLAWLVFNGLSDKLFDDRIYAAALVERDAYQRSYSQVLPESSIETFIGSRLGELPGFGPTDLAATLSVVAPPDYLQGQTEGNLKRAAAYFQGETDRLELYAELEQPLAQIRAEIRAETPDYPENRIAVAYLDSTIARFEAELNLDDRGRLNLLALTAGSTAYGAEAELRAAIARFRSDLRRSLSQGRQWSLIVVIAGTVALGLLYLPNLVGSLRWPGLTLLLSGATAFLLGWWVEATLPGRAAGWVSSQAGTELDFSPAAARLAAEVLESALAGLLAGIGNPALLAALVGAALLAASYGVARWRKPRSQR